MGSFLHDKARKGGRPPGKIDAPLNARRKNVKWGEYTINSLFNVCSSKKIFHANNVTVYQNHIDNSLPYVVRKTTNNGIAGYLIKDEKYANNGRTLSFAQDTFSVFYQQDRYFTGNKVKILEPKLNLSEKSLRFIATCIQQALFGKTWGKVLRKNQ